MRSEELAEELIKCRAELMHIPASKHMAKITQGEQFVLSYLMLNKTHSVHPKNISTVMEVSTARIAVLLNHMEERNLIIRRPDAEDNRQIIVEITDIGIELIKKYREKTIKNIAAVLEAIGEEDAEEYIRIEKKMAECLVKK